MKTIPKEDPGSAPNPEPSFLLAGGGLLSAQRFIKFQPRTGALPGDPAQLLHAFQMHFQFLRPDMEIEVVARPLQEQPQARQRMDPFQVRLVEGQHQRGRERPQPFVEDHRIVAAAFLAVVDVVQRMIKVYRGLRREKAAIRQFRLFRNASRACMRNLSPSMRNRS